MPPTMLETRLAPPEMSCSTSQKAGTRSSAAGAEIRMPKGERDGHGHQELCLGAVGQHQRRQAGEGGCRRDQDGPEPGERRVDQRIEQRIAAFPETVDAVDQHQGGVDHHARCRNDAEQRG